MTEIKIDAFPKRMVTTYYESCSESAEYDLCCPSCGYLFNARLSIPKSKNDSCTDVIEEFVWEGER